MRRGILYIVLALVFLVNSVASKAQTTLVLGDIAFTGFNVDAHPSDGGDHFSFVILRTGGIASGTTIRFTDKGWSTGACGTNGWAAGVEGDILWTATSALPYGRQVRISSAGTASTGTVSGTPITPAATGDQIFAIQGTIAGAHTMLAGIHMNEEIGITSATNWDNQAVPTAAQSNKPACIVNGTHGLFINPEVDNARLKPSVILSGNPATDRSRVNNVANWDVNDVTPFDLPGPLSGLPVEFTWVKATERSGKVQVDWGIGLEEEMKDYTLERSFDGRLYVEMGTVPASGKNTYTWTDVQPYTGVNYYRIRATEINGITKYSTVAIVNLSKGGKGIGVYPNVVRNNNFNLQMTNLPAGSYKLTMISAVGQVVYSRSFAHSGGSATQTVNLPAATPKGVYRINMSSGVETVITTVVVE
jgi:hypothetical protein